MLPLRSYIDQIYEALSINADDSNIDDRLITDLINQQRSLWVRNEYNKNRAIHEDMVQDLECVEVEKADRADCCNITLDDSCDVIRTKKEIPPPIEFNNTDGILRVGPIDKFKPAYSYITHKHSIWSGNGRYNQTAVFAFRLNNRIYIVSNSKFSELMQYINIRGIFEDPTDAGSFVNCNGSACYTSDTSYPIKDWQWVYMKPHIIQELSAKIKIPDDKTNDNQDNKKVTE